MGLSEIGCKVVEMEVSVSGRYEFHNQSDYTIKGRGTNTYFDLSPRDVYGFDKIAMRPKHEKGPMFLPPFSEGAVLIYDDKKCDTLIMDEGVLNSSNYEIQKIDKNDYEYIYTFLNEDYDVAQDCP